MAEQRAELEGLRRGGRQDVAPGAGARRAGRVEARAERDERADELEAARQALMRQLGPQLKMGWGMISETLAASRGDHWRMSDPQLDQLAVTSVECLAFYGPGPLSKHAPLFGLALALGNWTVPALMVEVQLARKRREEAARPAPEPAPEVHRYVDEEPTAEPGPTL